MNADAFEGEGEVAGAAAEVEDARVGAAQDALESSRGAMAPVAIQRKGQKVIQEVVARRDAAEHLAHARGGFAFVERADRPRAGQFRRPFDRQHSCDSRVVRSDFRRCGNGWEFRKRTLDEGHGKSTPHWTLPMRRGNTHRTRPLRAFLSPARIGRN